MGKLKTKQKLAKKMIPSKSIKVDHAYCRNL